MAGWMFIRGVRCPIHAHPGMWRKEMWRCGYGTVHALEKWLCICEGGIVHTTLCIHTARLRGKSRFNLDGRNIQCIIHSVYYLPLVKSQVI